MIVDDENIFNMKFSAAENFPIMVLLWLNVNFKCCRSELQEIRNKLEKEGVSKNDIILELEALREKHQNEILARDHARKLSK